MDSEFDLLETTFMNIQQQSENTIPQRCLVALIDVNRLKVNLSQLRQTVTKQLQRLKSILSLTSQAYQQASQQFIHRVQTFDNKHNTQKIFQDALIERDHRLLFFTEKVQQIQQQKVKLMGLLKKQTQTMSKLKTQHQFQIQRLNLRINELYSIIHQKSAIIDALQIEDNLNKEVIRSYQTYRKPRVSYEEQQSQISTTKQQNQSKSKDKFENNFTERKKSQQHKFPNTLFNKQKSFSGVPFNEVNISLDPTVMQKISDLITTITHTNINNNNCKQMEQTQKPKQNKIATHRQQYQKSQETEKFENRSTHRKSTLDNLFKNAMKGCKKNNKLFK